MYKRIGKETAKDILNAPESILLDIRDAISFEEGHDHNAIHITQENLSSFIANTEKTIPVLVMCYHGNSSQSVARYLTTQGFTEVYSIDGGYEEWAID